MSHSRYTLLIKQRAYNPCEFGSLSSNLNPYILRPDSYQSEKKTDHFNQTRYYISRQLLKPRHEILIDDKVHHWTIHSLIVVCYDGTVHDNCAIC